MTGSVTIRSVAVLACALLSACRQGDRADPPQTTPLLSVQRAFQVLPEEEACVDSLLEQTRVAMQLSHFAGVLFRFGRGLAADRQYLLYMIPPPAFRDGELLLVPLGSEYTAVPPFYTGVVFSPRASLAIEEVGDFDGDDLMDVAYCVWPAEEDGVPVVHAVGVRDNQWYELSNTASLPECTR